VTRWDNNHECLRCFARCHDVVEQRERRRLLIECCFCGMLMEVPGQISVPGDLTLKQGRFSGLKISEVLMQQDGEEYLDWLAGRTPSLKEAIQEVKRAAVRPAAAVIVPAAAVAHPEVAKNTGSRQPGLTSFHGRDGAPPSPKGGGAFLFD
jgi:hypothetical protein